MTDVKKIIEQILDVQKEFMESFNEMIQELSEQKSSRKVYDIMEVSEQLFICKKNSDSLKYLTRELERELLESTKEETHAEVVRDEFFDGYVRFLVEENKLR